MRFESVAKFYLLKSLMMSDLLWAMAFDFFFGIDVMAAMGMAQL